MTPMDYPCRGIVLPIRHISKRWPLTPVVLFRRGVKDMAVGLGAECPYPNLSVSPYAVSNQREDGNLLSLDASSPHRCLLLPTFVVSCQRFLISWPISDRLQARIQQERSSWLGLVLN